MKKLSTLIAIALVSIFALTSCGTSSNKENTSTTNTAKESTNSNSATYKDGTYKATYDKSDKRGWKPQITIVIQNGKIIKTDFNDIDKNGKLKTEDSNYGKSMKEKNGTEPKEFIPKLDQQLINSQTASKIDGITGATQSTTKFKELSKAALDKAKIGDSHEIILPMKEN
ncbi:FMN-binding protein [Clostridium thailandense]|uniref:FMN-binding protein n=1 Tax=Clostridium thailandense TaxID=2794346 RepID=UPI00398A3FE2